MNPTLAEMYDSGVAYDAEGKSYELHSSLMRDDAEFIHGIVADNEDFTRTLEVGCAYGASSLAICSALAGREGANHVIVDPFQYSQFHGIGMANLRRAGLDGLAALVQERSEFYLPKACEQGEGRLDFIFIDGWHTFDHTLLDLFYATRLLRVGGVVVVDDCDHPQVSRAVRYVSNYPCYEVYGLGRNNPSWQGRAKKTLRRLLPEAGAAAVLPAGVHEALFARVRFPRNVALRKVAEDQRDWSWWMPF